MMKGITIVFLMMCLCFLWGCKNHDDVEFSITGIWNFFRNVTYDDGHQYSYNSRFEFKGSETSGTFFFQQPIGGVGGGEYFVDGNDISITLYYGRGPAMYINHFSGKLFRRHGAMQGTVEGEFSMGAVVENTWSGTFAGYKEDEP